MFIVSSCCVVEPSSLSLRFDQEDRTRSLISAIALRLALCHLSRSDGRTLVGRWFESETDLIAILQAGQNLFGDQDS
jgi:hypothetical protein